MPLPDCFAIVPAAGRSLRMGARNKLLLPWSDTTIIDQVLRAWTDSLASHIVMVVRRDDRELQEVCQRWSTVDLVIPPHDPEDMKRSIQLGLRYIAAQFQPQNSDRWMVAPADLPTLASGLINQLIEASRDSDSIVVPRFGDRHGHPVSFPWSMSPDVFDLGRDQGINQLLVSRPVQWLELPAHEHPRDIDTPADYSRLSGGQEHS